MESLHLVDETRDSSGYLVSSRTIAMTRVQIPEAGLPCFHGTDPGNGDVACLQREVTPSGRGCAWELSVTDGGGKELIVAAPGDPLGTFRNPAPVARHVLFNLPDGGTRTCVVRDAG
jgi:hypothetical protein